MQSIKQYINESLSNSILDNLGMLHAKLIAVSVILQDDDEIGNLITWSKVPNWGPRPSRKPENVISWNETHWIRLVNGVTFDLELKD